MDTKTDNSSKIARSCSDMGLVVTTGLMRPEAPRDVIASRDTHFEKAQRGEIPLDASKQKNPFQLSPERTIDGIEKFLKDPARLKINYIGDNKYDGAEYTQALTTALFELVGSPTPTGNFHGHSDEIQKAVKAFQKQAGFAEKDQDGIAGGNTMRTLLKKYEELHKAD